MEFKTTKVRSKIQKWSSKCLDSYIYSSNGCMRDEYNDEIWHGNNIQIMSVCFDGDEIVGAAIETRNRSMVRCNIAVYVRPKYRKQGIAKKLLKGLRKRSDSVFYCSYSDAPNLFKKFTSFRKNYEQED